MKCIRSTSGKRAKKGDPRNHMKYQEQDAFVFVRVVSGIVPHPRIDRMRLYLDFRPRYNPFEARERLRLQVGWKMYLFILDSLGSSELIVILAAALIFFGPRRLPQLSRQLGKGLAEFRRASEDFKRTWEREVNLENFEKGVEPEENSIFDKATEKIRAAREAAALDAEPSATTAMAPSITPVDPDLVQPRETFVTD